MSSIVLLGLGNSPKQYHSTRHNAGWQLINYFNQYYKFSEYKKHKKSQLFTAEIAGYKVFNILIDGYMNLSGENFRDTFNFYQFKLSELYVLHDELDVSFGKVKYKQGGGNAGHNGLKSLDRCIGGPSYHRLRLGIGKDPHSPTERYVLENFTKQEEAHLIDVYWNIARNLPTLFTNPPLFINNLALKPLDPV